MPSDAYPLINAIVADYFDRLYRSEERYWWRQGDRYSSDPDEYPGSLLTQVTLRLLRDRHGGQTGLASAGRALDLGAGEGADSIRLALLGYAVTAVDISAVAAEKIRRFAAAAGVVIAVKTADISRYRPDGEFDIVICNGVLHYISDKAGVIERIQAATRPGGLNVVSSWSTYTAVPACHNTVPVYCDHEDGVIVSAYRGWDVKLKYFERDKPESSHVDMPEHTHSHIKLVAEKPAP